MLLDVNFNESLTNDVVNFEQLGPEISLKDLSTANCRTYFFFSQKIFLTAFSISQFRWCKPIHSIRSHRPYNSRCTLMHTVVRPIENWEVLFYNLLILLYVYNTIFTIAKPLCGIVSTQFFDQHVSIAWDFLWKFYDIYTLEDDIVRPHRIWAWEWRAKIIKNINKVMSSKTALTHCRLNRLCNIIYWKSPISSFGTSGYEILIFLEKNG